MTGEPLTIDWLGASGRSYRYWIYPVGTAFVRAPGNYVYAKELDRSQGHWSPISIGECEDLSVEFSGYREKSRIATSGATHVHVHQAHEGLQSRLSEETDISQKWKAPPTRADL